MRKISVLIIILGIFFAGAGQGLAQESIDADGGLSITPFLKEVELSGDQKESTFPLEIENSSKSPVNISFSTADLGSLNETGGVMILDAQKNAANGHSLAAWIKLEKESIVLAAGEKKSIPVKIINGAGLAPGGHYGVVIASIENVSDGNDGSVLDIRLNSKMTSLIFLRKTGGETYDLALRSEETDASFFSLPKKSRSYFENKGNVHVTARGLVSVIDPLGREIEKGVINNESGIILPGSVRVFPTSLVQNKVAFLPGAYKIITKYRYDGRNEFIVQEKMFLHLPLISNGFFCVILLLLTYGLVGWIRKNKKMAAGMMKIKTKIKAVSINNKERYDKLWIFMGLSREKEKIGREGRAEAKGEIAGSRKDKLVLFDIFKQCIGKIARIFAATGKKVRPRSEGKTDIMAKTVSSLEKNDKAYGIVWLGEKEMTVKMEERGIKTKPKTKDSVPKTSCRQFGKAKLFNYLFAAVLVGAGIALFYFYDILFQRPVSGEIRTEASRIGRTENSPMERFEAVHLSFRHSPTYQVNFHEKGIVENKNILERALLSQKGFGNRRIALTVEDMNNRNLTDVANYNLRQKKTSMYRESKFVSGDLSGIAFVSRAEGLFEKTVFISREQKLIEISFSGPLNNENELEREVADTLGSIQWKK